MANPKHLRILKKDGVEAWNAWRKQAGDNLNKVDLSGANLCEANIGEADLRGANLFLATDK